MKSVIIDGIKHAEETPNETKLFVIVRTYSAGVHAGYLESHKNKEVVLKDARRLWRWRGANTLNEVAVNGIVTLEYSRVSEVVPEITLTEAIEIIPTSAKAKLTLAPVWNN